MRKRQQKQIFELIETLRDAQSAGLYADAQEGALAVGAFIEQIEGEGNPRIAGTIALLEEYCELLYGASKGEVGGKALRKHLIKLENDVRDDLAPDRIEVLFVSYNASMSDSILSIYTAAKADPACDAVWLPVPYFEKNRDGAFGAMRYEGAECYPGTDCADWREYDIAARRPDAIFTFNPYDASNIVTSVHPDFYCERLRGLTDLLVYVPYFVAVNDVSEHFCTVAGCVYAHKVVVQSEEIRDTYIRVFKKAYGNRLGRPEDKFVALGSPKFDAVLNAKREDFELPDAWRGLMGDRKVIFYNTSVGAILAGGAQYLKKLRHVLDVFRERDDALLWWRPHPLSEATYDSMRLELADEYRAIVAGYRREGFGIYDDTADLHRAIAWTDAYYGDGSSVVEIYKETGKSIMYQNVNLAEAQNGGILPCLYLTYFDADYIYYSEENFNAFCRINKTTYEVECLGKFPVENNLSLYRNIVKVEDKLYFTPLNASEIAIYDLSKSQFIESVKIKRIEGEWHCGKLTYKRDEQGYGGFSYSVVFGRYIYFMPYKYPAIVRLDTVTNAVDYYNDFLMPISKYENNRQDGLFYFSERIDDNKFVVSSLRSNDVMIYDTETNTQEIHAIGNGDYCFILTLFDGENFWFVPRTSNTPIIKWNKDKGVLKAIDISHLTPAGSIVPFFKGVCFENFIYLFSYSQNPPLMINMKTHELTEIDCLKDKYIKQGGVKVYFYAVNFENGLFYIYQKQTNLLYIYEARTGNLTCRELKVAVRTQDVFRQNFNEAKINIVKHNQVLFEYEPTYLDSFINYITDNGIRLKEQDNDNAGQRIYDFVKSQIL